jgi:hypothetical protein
VQWARRAQNEHLSTQERCTCTHDTSRRRFWHAMLGTVVAICSASTSTPAAAAARVDPELMSAFQEAFAAQGDFDVGTLAPSVQRPAGCDQWSSLDCTWLHTCTGGRRVQWQTSVHITLLCTN